ncbi:hypothetical protein PR048_025126 [Dryococelus australis]|uniref:CCHC-type domain-containing protein n=1 Tax=Dryococelus australis TaxID=614101 RepID=A0ABQ9GQL0_9NEOP|nr:hypothetical protein PR048_025126 [Dryococelus australis]
MGLPMEKYEGFVRSLERDEKAVSTKLAKAGLLIEEKRMYRDAEVDEISMALSTKRKQTPIPRKNNQLRIQRFWICYACGEKWHIAKNCVHYRDEHKERGKRSADEDEAREINKSEDQVLCVKQPTLKSSQWLLDSGASHHMTPHPELIENMTEETGVVGIADGEPLQIRGRSTVLLQMSEECGGWSIRLSTVLYVPNLSDNLISVSCIEGLGKYICFEKGCAKIIDRQKEETLFKAIRVGNLYHVRTLNAAGTACPKDKSEIEGIGKASRADVTIWHRRLGHCHEGSIVKIPVIGVKGSI